MYSDKWPKNININIERVSNTDMTNANAFHIDENKVPNICVEFHFSPHHFGRHVNNRY